MTDVQEQIERNRYHQKNANGLEMLDLEYLHELFGRNADTMEKLLAVYEAAMRLKPWKQHWGEELAEALAAVEER